MKRQLKIIPIQHNQCEIETIGSDIGVVLPKITVIALPHSMEIKITDLSGDPVHIIVIRQNGDVEVDP